MNIKEICICGGGNLGTVCAGVFLSKGIKVSIFSARPEKWSNHIKVHDPENRVFEGNLNKVSDKAQEVVPNADIVLLCVPGYLIQDILTSIRPYLKNDTLVGSVVSSTGFFFQAHNLLKSTQPLFGFQRVPYIARIEEYGKVANLLGYKKQLNVVIENLNESVGITLLEYLFDTPVKPLKSYLEVSLSNSNPILHTGRLYALWKDYKDKIYDHSILFYSEWDDISSEIVLEMDKEFMALVSNLGIKNSIPSLLEYYEVSDVSSFTRKIKSIESFKNIESPMKKTDQGWIPDFSSRYFTEDFSFGLKYIHYINNKIGLKLDKIEEVLSWGIKMLNFY